ncbi:MAG TPA: 2-amino-4-hydroxy-6-hydroxymethyldihydropteridine diphosphokinase [Longimicrobiaceae bacterium]|nr:2-amino-4-hydroxy-6-hydroxymethyldihydropteridine diphosphokinase [Longimicrobiaceae bacterium]
MTSTSSPEDGPADVLLGLGANLGDPLGQLREAVARLGAFVEEIRVSSVYRTEPVGYGDQPDFYNLVAAGRTRLPPEALLAAVLEVEREMGRVRTFANAPRVIDVDVLAYGGRVMRTEALTLPHPGIAHRGFVLHPLAEVAPDWVHPTLGHTARELLAAARSLKRVERAGPLGGA